MTPLPLGSEEQLLAAVDHLDSRPHAAVGCPDLGTRSYTQGIHSAGCCVMSPPPVVAHETVKLVVVAVVAAVVVAAVHVVAAQCSDCVPAAAREHQSDPPADSVCETLVWVGSVSVFLLSGSRAPSGVPLPCSRSTSRSLDTAGICSVFRGQVLDSRHSPRQGGRGRGETWM